MTAARWLVSARFDLAFFLSPAALAIAVLWLSPAELVQRDDLPVWIWVALIPLVDVSHVYASLYRTYFDRDEIRRRKGLYYGVPALLFVAGAMLHSIDALVFWRVLAYAAVWHFVRQQYGFLALYRHRAGERSGLESRLDAAVLYVSMLYPLVYWHTHLPRKFLWLVDGDFLPIPAPGLSRAVGAIYLALAVVYVVKEARTLAAGPPWNVGKNLVIATTAATWYVGIVVYDSDYSFTVTNVIAHGVPYVALVWIYCRRKWLASRTASWLAIVSQPRFALAFVGILAVLALCEEALWDRLVWGDHPDVFAGVFGGRNQLAAADSTIQSPLQALVVSLLALPQATHYVLDGFIWKMNATNPDLRKHLLP